MEAEERETTIVFDHYTKKVQIFTTQPDVYRGFLKRLGKRNAIFSADNAKNLYSIECSEDVLRKPYYVAPVTKQ